MLASILTIGDELLEGRVDTNSAWISQALDRIGWRVQETRHCRDDVDAIARNLQELASLTDLVVTTGGLGPTTDDLTTEAVARWAGVELELHQETWDWIQARFKERGYPLAPENIKQAYFPKGGTPIINRRGTAMSYMVERNGRYVASFPGVPREMKSMVDATLLPLLQEKFPPTEHRVVRKIKVFGHTESGVNALMTGITVGVPGVEIAYLVSYPEVSLFFKVTRKEKEEAAAVAEQLVAEAKLRLGDKAYGEGEATLEGCVGELLKAKGLWMAAAESCTGGLVAQKITDVPGSSAYFSEGVVTYTNRAKERYLGVRKETLKEFGAVSADTCAEMLDGILQKSGADVAVAITGIAGPGGGTEEKPVGLVYIGWGDLDGQEVREFRFRGERQDLRQVSAATALDLLRRFLLRRGT